MTNERAKSELEQLYMSLSEEKKKALDVAFKAMEQAQADGEYISRGKMLMFLNDMRFGIAPDETVADDDERREREAQVDVLDDLIEVVEQMPSVAIPSAEPKTGHWEWVQYDSNPNIGNWHCSECRTIIPHMPEETDNTPIYKWCPMCGARMVEPQERSK